MPTRIKMIKMFTRMILTSNAFAFMWMTFVYLPPAPRSAPQLDLFHQGARIFSQPFNVQEREYVPGEAEKTVCIKRFILLGMRDHWNTFCKYPEFARYKSYIVFPRLLECPETQCSILINFTVNPREIRGYDVVIFTNVYDWLSGKDWDWIHGNRTAGQRWVMISEESPLYVPGVKPPRKYGNTTYDWIDSYKSDSDFVHPYGYYEPFGDITPPKEDLRKFLHPKRDSVRDNIGQRNRSHGLIAWMGSHCETLQWNRQKFVNDLLGTGVRLDKFGKCGEREIVWNNDQKILEELGRYKFYLSLENSCCDEYITEKFWRALQMGIVPIVVGAPLEHYMKLAPPNSFIHVDQFESMTELAVHLIELNGDDSKYLEYFKWRHEGKLVSYTQEEQYIRPLSNQTNCDVLKKLLNTNPNDRSKLDFYGDSWIGSCRKCSSKSWVNRYMLPRNHSRTNSDIWA